jgi:hypothetical protein
MNAYLKPKKLAVDCISIAADSVIESFAAQARGL